MTLLCNNDDVTKISVAIEKGTSSSINVNQISSSSGQNNEVMTAGKHHNLPSAKD